jgi:hypothetical protein
MLRRVSSLLILVAVLLSIISPFNLAFIHLPRKNKVLFTFDVCHASSPLQPANADVPSYPEQICCCLSIPGFAGFYTALSNLLMSSLISSPKEKPPRV